MRAMLISVNLVKNTLNVWFLPMNEMGKTIISLTINKSHYGNSQTMLINRHTFTEIILLPNKESGISNARFGERLTVNEPRTQHT